MKSLFEIEADVKVYTYVLTDDQRHRYKIYDFRVQYVTPDIDRNLNASQFSNKVYSDAQQCCLIENS